MHCKSPNNPCRGIAECTCECPKCLEADEVASEVDAGAEPDESPAATDHFEAITACDGCGREGEDLDQRVDFPGPKGRAPMLCAKCQGKVS